MATKAQRYLAEEQVSRSRLKAKDPKTKKKPKAKKRTAKKPEPTVDASIAGVSGAGKAQRNFARRSNNTGGPALEVSDASKPSRKSTRSSAGRVKQASNLTRRQKRRVHSPKERAARAAVRG